MARLQLLTQLEEPSIGFSIPLPHPNTEGELLGKQGVPVTLPNLKLLTFQGVSSYLERLTAQINAPLLEHLDITLFDQIAFALSHLSHFIKRTEGFKLFDAEVLFWRDVVCIALGRHSGDWYDRRFVLRVKCTQLDWQIDCAGQICRELMPVLSGMETLTLDFHEEVMPAEWQGAGEIDDTTWHELLRSFIGVKELRIWNSLSEELSRALEIALDPGLLPLENLIIEFRQDPTTPGGFPASNEKGQRICRQCGLPGRYKAGKCVEKWGPGPSGPGTVCDRCYKKMKRVERRGTLGSTSLSRSFLNARQVAGHPVDLSFSPLRPLSLSPGSLPIFCMSFQAPTK